MSDHNAQLEKIKRQIGEKEQKSAQLDDQLSRLQKMQAQLTQQIDALQQEISQREEYQRTVMQEVDRLDTEKVIQSQKIHEDQQHFGLIVIHPKGAETHHAEPPSRPRALITHTLVTHTRTNYAHTRIYDKNTRIYRLRQQQQIGEHGAHLHRLGEEIGTLEKYYEELKMAEK